MPYAELTVDQGTTFESTIDLVNDDGSPVNIASYLFSGQIRKSYYSSSTTAEFSIQIVDAANGEANIILTSETTASIKPGRYVYDIKMTDTQNTVTRIVEGILTVTPQVTR